MLAPIFIVLLPTYAYIVAIVAESTLKNVTSDEVQFGQQQQQQ